MKQYLENLYKEKSPYIKQINGTIQLNSKYKLGKIVFLKEYAFLELLNNSSQKIYIDFDYLNGANNNDIVLVQIIFNPKGKTKAKVLKVLERSKQTFLAFIQDKKLYSLQYNIVIDNNFILENYNEGDILKVEATQIKKLGNINNSSIDEIISLYLYNQEYRLEQFPNEKFFLQSTTNRVDLTELDFCTIDPNNAKDFDDAIYFDEKNSILYVAIADVSAYITIDSKIDLEAQKRAFSIYLPHKVFPMLPFELSNNLCSLVSNKQRASFVFKLYLDLDQMIVKKSELFEATIISKHRYTYKEIDTILQKANKDNYFVKLFKITKQFKQKRLKKGYDFRSHEIKLILNNNQELIATELEKSTPSHSLVEECMLLANCEAAKRIQNLGVFRVHEEPSQNNIIKLLDDIKALGIKVKLKSTIHETIQYIQKKAKEVNLQADVDWLIIQAQQQAHYSNKSNIHFGLGFESYSHFTSPIRRYADLILHRILKTNKIPKDLDTIVEYLSDTQRKIDQLVWDFEDRKYARWASKNIGQSFKAKMIDIDNFIAVIDDKISGARVKILNYAGEKQFMQIEIILESANIITKEITARII